MATLTTPRSPTTPPASKLHVSKLAPHHVQSEIRAMSTLCAEANGINMAQGVCDTDPPSAVVEAAIAAIHAGHNIYTRLDGIASLREAIAAKLARFNRLHVDANNNVLVTSGATGALYAAVQALLNPGDACLVLEPFYGYHLFTLRALGVEPIVVPLAAHTFALDLDRLRAAITPKTRAIIPNSPSNPSGRVFSQAELEQLAAFATEHDLFVFSDEIYEHFLYDGRAHQSIGALDGMAERTITISGFSKTFSVTGWRLGYLAAHERWLPAISYFHDLTYVCAPAPLQHGAAAGLLTLPESFYAEMTAEYQAKRDSFCAALQRAGLTPIVPEGAYYVLADASRIDGEDAKQKARTLLRETGVASVAGSAFLATRADGTNPGDHLLRFCFAKKDADLAAACARLEARQRA
jgi:aminotransferase